MDNNYDELENQIGSMGADPTEIVADNTDSIKGKKLKYKSSYGKKEELNDDEKESLNVFLSRGHEKRDEINIGDGWVPVNREEMGVRSDFYPEAWEFFIKPATVASIKNWTAIDEERPDQVHKIMNEICKACIRIDTHDVQGAGWTQINSWDRFWFILKIREYTFAKGESKIEFEDSCSECDADVKFTLNADSLFYEFPDEDIVEKYWVDGKWEIDPTEYDVEHDIVTLYTPKLGKDDAIIEWAANKVRNKQKVDETFLRFLVWMLPKPAKDQQMLDRQIQRIYKEYKSWSVDMFQFMDDVITNITINPSERLRCKCPHCGGEATSNVQFPDGIKVLFKTETKVKKFGSR